MRVGGAVRYAGLNEQGGVRCLTSRWFGTDTATKEKTKKQKKEVNTNPSVGEFEDSGTGGCPA